MLFQRKLTIVRIDRPSPSDINNTLQWFGSSLGLFNDRDKDSSCFRIFIELLKANKKREMLSSDVIAEHLALTRGTVVHHINKLMVSGIVVKNNKRYLLRVSRLSSLIDELHRDMDSACRDLRHTAEEIDKCMGI